MKETTLKVAVVEGRYVKIRWQVSIGRVVIEARNVIFCPVVRTLCAHNTEALTFMVMEGRLEVRTGYGQNTGS